MFNPPATLNGKSRQKENEWGLSEPGNGTFHGNPELQSSSPLPPHPSRLLQRMGGSELRISSITTFLGRKVAPHQVGESHTHRKVENWEIIIHVTQISKQLHLITKAKGEKRTKSLTMQIMASVILGTCRHIFKSWTWGGWAGSCFF